MNALAHDEANLIDTENFWESRYRNPVLIVVAALLLTAAGLVWWRVSLIVQAETAVQAWGQTKTLEEKIKVAETHRGTPIIAIALLQIAELQVNKSDFAAAQKTYEQFLSTYPKHPLVNGARLGLAQALETQNKTKEALELYQQIAKQKPTDNYNPLGLLAVARLQLAQKNIVSARQALEDGAALYSLSPYAGEFREQLAQLPKAN